MKRIARFEKVSFEQFKKDYESIFGNSDNVLDIYENIKLPKRATKGSAGHDFFAPFSFVLKAKQSIKIPTGIRVKIDEGWVLKCYPRSGLGTKYRLQLDNTVPIIDADYYNSDNEGHIFIKMTNDSRNHKDLSVSVGDSIMQGIFVPFGITYDDAADGIRNGGFGSTGKQ